MNIFTIPARNIRRKPSKTLLLLLVFTLGVMSIVTLYQVSLVVGHNFEQKLTAFGANIIISPVRETLNIGYGGFQMGEMLVDIEYLPEEETLRAIRAIALKDRISAVAPKLVTMAKVNNTAVAVVGVRWPDERGIKSYWAADGRFPERPDEVLIGSRVSAGLGLVNGEKTILLGREFTVSGTLYETGSDDDTVILMDLSTLQDLVGKPGATSFTEVSALCAGCPIEDIVSQIRSELPGTDVKALQHIVNQRMASVHFIRNLALAVSLVILVTAGAMVGLSMLSAVNERKKDIGILRSIGFGKGQVFAIFCMEAGIIGVIAGLIGYVFGFFASFKVLELLALGEGISPSFSVIHLLLVGVFFGLVTVCAALYPSWKGAAIEPSAALVAL
ncbi:MAG: ABC transporter permease [Desulfobulbaceae bacterium BRH_c16a]|nr:MAG: ABC transporter permease [Desulfobulbaceae bacterium BRH_c16a]